jgi:hypothetical protein
MILKRWRFHWKVKMNVSVDRGKGGSERHIMTSRDSALRILLQTANFR